MIKKNYEKEKEGNKNRKFGLEPRLAYARKLAYDMFNMPMNEPCLVWFLK
jgi:hypothetical protein